METKSLSNLSIQSGHKSKREISIINKFEYNNNNMTKKQLANIVASHPRKKALLLFFKGTALKIFLLYCIFIFLITLIIFLPQITQIQNLVSLVENTQQKNKKITTRKIDVLEIKIHDISSILIAPVFITFENEGKTEKVYTSIPYNQIENIKNDVNDGIINLDVAPESSVAFYPSIGSFHDQFKSLSESYIGNFYYILISLYQNEKGSITIKPRTKDRGENLTSPSKEKDTDDNFYFYFSLIIVAILAKWSFMVNKRRDVFIEYFKAEDLDDASDCVVEKCQWHEKIKNSSNVNFFMGQVYKVRNSEGLFVIYNGTGKKTYKGKVLEYGGHSFFISNSLIDKSSKL